MLATSISFLLLEYDVSKLLVELAEGEYTSPSDIIQEYFNMIDNKITRVFYVITR